MNVSKNRELSNVQNTFNSWETKHKGLDLHWFDKKHDEDDKGMRGYDDDCLVWRLFLHCSAQV